MFTGDTRRRRGCRLLLAAALGLIQAAPAWAIFLDKEQNVSLRGRVYTQFSIRAEDSPSTTNYVSQANPEFKAGQLVQNRFFYNPELDANLTSYTKWMRDVGWLGWLAPDEFGFRAAAWGFYDGIYDYGSSQYDDARRRSRITPQGELKPFVTGRCNGGSNAGNPCTTNQECPDGGTCNLPGFGLSNLPLPQQTVDTVLRPCTRANGCVTGTLYSQSTGIPDPTVIRAQLQQGVPLETIFEPTSARDVFASQTRINELYLNYTKGPLFVRLGRQSISWGEADTIALLDANNPFDVTVGVPGIFQDLDEARIPLWTIRSSYQLFSQLGPFSSGFLEAYWVPGSIDNNVAVAPFPLGVSGYGQTGADPHLLTVGNLVDRFAAQGPNGINAGNAIGDVTSIVLVDKLPEKKMSRSRGGVRLETIVGREHTVSGWWYRTYNNAPVARLVTPPDVSGARDALPAISSTERADVDVFGVADTFFVEPIDSIIRLEAEYFLNEMSFLDWRPALPPPREGQPAPNPNYYASESIRQMANIPQDFTTNYGKPVPRTNHLRWETGIDRFAFIRFLNPTNSFFATFSFVGDYNIDATSQKRYGFGPGRPTKPFEGFFQLTTQTDYMHGRLTPRLTTIYNWSGAFAINAKLDYRVADYLILGLQYTVIDGAFHQIGFFRDYDQVALRATFQLN